MTFQIADTHCMMLQDERAPAAAPLEELMQRMLSPDQAQLNQDMAGDAGLLASCIELCMAAE